MKRNFFQKIHFLFQGNSINDNFYRKNLSPAEKIPHFDSIIIFSFGKNQTNDNPNFHLAEKVLLIQNRYKKTFPIVTQEEVDKYLPPALKVKNVIYSSEFNGRTPSSYEVAQRYKNFAIANNLYTPLIVAEENHLARCVLIFSGYNSSHLGANKL